MLIVVSEVEAAGLTDHARPNSRHALGDVVEHALEALVAALGVDVFDQPADAVRDTSIIVTVLKDGAAVGETMNAALSGVRPGTTWLQLSTVGIEATDTLARLATEKSIAFYDSPVQGTRQPAEQGKLVILASGPEAGRDIAQRVYDAIGQRTIWISDAPGASSRLKLALNAFVFALTHGTAETLAIARALGIDPARGQYADPQAARDEAVRSATLAAAFLMLAAEAKGFASCPMVGFDALRVKQAFDLSKKEVPVMLLAIGRAARGNWPQKSRRPIEVILSLR